MDSGQLIAIIVGVVLVLAVVAVALVLGRKRKMQANREEAAEIRERVQADELTAKEREANAARAEADARQAEVEAERLRREALDRQREAETARKEAQEQLRKADKLDPDGANAGRGDARPQEGAADAATNHPDVTPEQPRQADGTRQDAGQGGARHVADDQNRGDRPRNL